MSSKSKIEWTEASWNPVTGCSKVSPGCKHCYAEAMSRRLKAIGNPNYRNGFQLTIHEQLLYLPLKWKKPKTIFVNSMSDLFHEDVPRSFIQRVFEVIKQASHHRFQVLTKRSKRLLELNHSLDWPDNVWMGVSVESDQYLHRIDDLRQTDAHIKFISFEPLLGSIPHLNLEGIDWVIVGGESGSGARPMNPDWVRSIRDECQEAGTPFFFKQWGEWSPFYDPVTRQIGNYRAGKQQAGRMLDGRTWDEMPEGKS